jgi:copper oxidase (laccase) domain-containing protein
MLYQSILFGYGGRPLKPGIFMHVPGIVHAVSPDCGIVGNMSLIVGEEENAVIRERVANFQRLAGLPEEAQVVRLGAKHGRCIVDLFELNAARGEIAADAVVFPSTIFAYLNSADCVPMTIYAPSADICALVHCSRLNAHLLPDAVIAHLCDDYGCQVEELLVHVGPSIGRDSFRWQGPLPEELKLETWKRHISPFGDGHLIDLKGFVTCCLIARGVLALQVEVSPVDTFANPNYFSNSRTAKGDPVGRFQTIFGRIA